MTTRPICIEQINVIIGAIQSAIPENLLWTRLPVGQQGRAVRRGDAREAPMAFMGLLITSDKMLILCSFDLRAEDTALSLKLSSKGKSFF